jgi:hypothetical protein
MKNKLLLCLTFILFSFSICAQNNGDVRTQINSIKKSSLYIYADVTAATEQDAKDLGENELYENINEWVATRKKLRNSANIIINNRKELWSVLKMPRGNMFRVFLYVKKRDIQGADNADVIDNPNAASNTEFSKGSKVEDINTIVVPTSVLDLSKTVKYADFVGLLKQKKSEGKVTFYGRYASLENPDIYYIAIYDKDGNMKAFLTPGRNRKNIASGVNDDVTNYSGCGAIGFTVTDK